MTDKYILNGKEPVATEDVIESCYGYISDPNFCTLFALYLHLELFKKSGDLND